MAYRNRTFVSFASEDILYYRLMRAWKANEHIEFDFLDAHDINTARDTSSAETIKRRLTERLQSTKQVVMLISDVTRTKAARATSFLNHEVDVIQRLQIPVVFANLNKVRQVQNTRIPAALVDRYTMSVAFGPKIIKYALDDFPSDYDANLSASLGTRKSTGYYYLDSVYSSLGL
jgi:hypothetical protein